MSYCGQEPSHRLQRRPANHFSPTTQSPVVFEYTGRTNLTFIGPFSWKKYHFEAPGAQVLIDPQDVVSMNMVPYLKRVYPI